MKIYRVAIIAAFLFGGNTMFDFWYVIDLILLIVFGYLIGFNYEHKKYGWMTLAIVWSVFILSKIVIGQFLVIEINNDIHNYIRE